MRERREELQAQGLCVNCAVNPSSEGTYCDSCKVARQEHARRRLAEVFDKFLEMYGRVCACCGETERGFLTADHINNDGWKERKPNGGSLTSSEMIYRRLIRKRRDDIQTLCYNCNCARARLGYCPHKPEERVERRVRGARRRDGEHNTQAKLTEVQVLEVRASSESYAALSRKYGISDVAARFVKLGITYPKVMIPDSLMDEAIPAIQSEMTKPSEILIDPEIAPNGLVCDVEVSVGQTWKTMEAISVATGMAA